MSANPNLAPVINPEEASVAATNEALAAVNAHFATGEVPSIEALAKFGQVAQGVTETAPGQFQDDKGNQLDAETAQTFKKNADPATWMLSTKEAAEDQGIFEAASLDELDEDLADRILMNKQPDESESQVFERVQASAEKRLVLSEQLHKAKAEADEAAAVQAAHTNKVLGADKNGRIRVAAGNSKGGRFVSKYEEELIKEHVDQIEAGIPELVSDILRKNSAGQVIAENGRFMSKDAVLDVSNNQNAIRGDRPNPNKQQDKEVLDSLTMDAETEAAIDNPATATAKGIRGRLQKLRGRVNLAITERQLGRVEDKDEQFKRRTRLVGATAGAVLLAGLTYASLKGVGGLESGTAHAAEFNPDLLSGDASGVEAVGHGEASAIEAALNSTDAAKEVATHVLQDGESPWKVAEQLAGANASVGEIDAIKDSIMELNGWTELQAENLDVGTEMKVPK